MIPPWDTAIALLGSKDRFGHHNPPVSSAIAPQASLPMHSSPRVDKWEEGGLPLYHLCYVSEGSPSSSASTPAFSERLCETAPPVFSYNFLFFSTVIQAGDGFE